MVHEELCLLPFFDVGGTEVGGSHRSPIDVAKVVEAVSELGIRSASVAERKGPGPLLRGRPRDDGTEVSDEVNDRSLTTLIVQVSVVLAVDYEQHERPGTEVERHELADRDPGMTGHWQPESSLLDARHPDRGLRGTSCDHDRIGEQAVGRDDLWKIVDMRDVEDARLGWWRA